MITANFETQRDALLGVSVSGHANFADYGNDIVCSAVTSALEMCANGITHVLKEDAKVIVEENRVVLRLPDNASKSAEAFLEAFLVHLKNLKEEYPENIKIISTEV